MSKVKIQFDIDQQTDKSIKQTMKDANIASRVGYIDYAFTIFQWALANAKEGRIIVALDEKTQTYKELSMPPLDTVKPSTGEIKNG